MVTPKAGKQNLSLSDLIDEAAPKQPDCLDESRSQLRKEATSLLSEAQDALSQDLCQAAERGASDALQVFRELGDKSGAAKSLRVLIAAMQGRSEPQLAYDRASEELARCREYGNKVGEAAMTLSLAELKLETAARKEVTQMAKSGLAIAKQVQDRSLEADAFLVLARSYEMPAKTDHMMRAARAALEAYRQLGDQKGEAQAYHCMASAASLSNNLKEAVRCSEEAVYIAHQLGSISFEASELLFRAELYKMQKEYGLMLQDAEEAVKLFQKIDDLHGESDALRLVIKAHSLSRCEEKALEITEEALEQFRDQRYKRGEAIALDQKASILYNLGRVEEALETALDTLELVRALEDASWEAVMLHSVASLYCASKRFEESLKVSQEALWILEELGDRTGQAYVRLNTVLLAQTQLRQHQEALSTASEAMAIFRELKDRKGEATALLLAANVYKTVGYLDEAEKWLLEAQEIFENLGERRLLAQVLHGIAKVHIEREEPAEAIRLGYEAHALCKRARDKMAEAGTLLFTVEAHLSLIAQMVQSGRGRGSRELEEQLSKAQKAGSAAKKIAEKIGHSQTVADCCYALSEVNLVAGDYEQALQGADSGIKMYKDIGYQLGECTFVNMKAQALLVSGRNDEALAAANEALSLAKMLDDDALEGLAKEILDKVLSGSQTPVQQMPQMMPQQKDQEQREESETFEQEAASKVEEEKPQGLEPALVSDMLHTMLRDMIGSEMESDTPFMDAGVDSLMSIEFRSQVNTAFSGLGLSSTLTFDYPTIRELTGHIVEKSNNQ